MRLLDNVVREATGGGPRPVLAEDHRHGGAAARRLRLSEHRLSAAGTVGARRASARARRLRWAAEGDGGSGAGAVEAAIAGSMGFGSAGAVATGSGSGCGVDRCP